MAMCNRCEDTRILSLTAKCGDLCVVELDGKTHDGYVPKDLGISDDGDHIDLAICQNCGQVQGKYPNRATLPEQYCHSCKRLLTGAEYHYCEDCARS